MHDNFKNIHRPSITFKHPFSSLSHSNFSGIHRPFSSLHRSSSIGMHHISQVSINHWSFSVIDQSISRSRTVSHTATDSLIEDVAMSSQANSNSPKVLKPTSKLVISLQFLRNPSAFLELPSAINRHHNFLGL